MKNLLLLLFFLKLNIAHAQKKQSIWFLNNDGREVKKEDADFYRVIQRDPGSENFLVFEYYPDKTRKFIGKASAYEPWLEYEGPAIWYDKSGSKIKTVTFAKGTATGPASFYYPDGKISKIVEYSTDSGMNAIERGAAVKVRVKQCLDSAGSEIPMDGTHILNEADENDSFEESGAYLNGLKNGIWTGQIRASDSHYRENYNNGELISGEITLKDGTKTAYAKIQVPPEFPGGKNEMMSYMDRTFRWPRAIVHADISGIEILSFMVGSDGSLSDVKLTHTSARSPSTTSIKRVPTGSPTWKPGLQHGSPVSFAYTMPFYITIKKDRH